MQSTVAMMHEMREYPPLTAEVLGSMRQEVIFLRGDADAALC